MGQTTPNIGIYLPAAGETNYSQSFDEGMVNIDQHDHSGGPNKGVPISTGGLADFSVTYNKLNANVADVTTGIGVSSTLPNQLVILDLLKNIFQIPTTTGFIAKNGILATARTITGTAGRITVTNGDGASGNPVIDLDAAVTTTSVLGTANQITASTSLGVTTLSLAAPNVIPTQPAFLATVTLPQDDVTGDGTVYKVLFGTEVFDQGSNYDNATSRFTAPIAGVYLFGISLYLGDVPGSNGDLTLDLYVNGSLAYQTIYFNPAGWRTTTGFIRPNVSQLIKLNASDYVEVYLRLGGYGLVIDIDSGSFSGTLLC